MSVLLAQTLNIVFFFCCLFAKFIIQFKACSIKKGCNSFFSSFRTFFFLFFLNPQQFWGRIPIKAETTVPRGYPACLKDFILVSFVPKQGFWCRVVGQKYPPWTAGLEVHSLKSSHQWLRSLHSFHMATREWLLSHTLADLVSQRLIKQQT